MSSLFSTLLGLSRLSLAALFALCSFAAAGNADSLVDRTNRGLVVMIIGDDGASIDLARDLASVIDDGATRRLLPAIGHGAVQNVIDLKALRGIDIGIVQTDSLTYAKEQRGYSGVAHSLTYIAKLYNEELHVLARADVRGVEDLRGKKVNFGGNAFVTGPAVFKLLGIEVEPSFDDRVVALEQLKAGKVAALAYLAAKPTPFFTGLDGKDGLHFLAIPLTPQLASAYVPTRLAAEDYPNLIHADAPVDTVAVGLVMMVAGLQPYGDRYRNVANFVDAFFTQFPQLQEAQRHPKWQEVNLAAELPGWNRFPAADAWLKRNVVAQAPALNDKELREVFTKFLDERSRMSGGKLMSAQEKDQLFDQFRRWQTSQTR
jgi:TRAP-type uncharacterized transport system substrate-binding protein